jgi:uncharacterized protein Yka (UPF0111/DUF47 family)
VPPSLLPQKREFFVLLDAAGRNAQAIAGLLVELVHGWPDSRERLHEIRELESEGDRLTHAVITLLNQTFVTPFDREDIFRLATALDDVCDHVDEAADDFDAYEVTTVPALARRQAEIVHMAASRLYEAVALLPGFRDSSHHLTAVRELESEGDRVEREAVADLFRTSDDPLTVIRWKDIHAQLEDAVDACETATDVLEAILVKNR